MLSASSRARMLAQPLDLRRRCALRRDGHLPELLLQPPHGALVSPRCRSSSPANSARVAACSSPMAAACPSKLLQLLPLRLPAPLRAPRAAAPSPPPPPGCARAARPISRRRAAAAPAPAAPPKAASWRAPGRRPACASRDRAPRDPSRAPAAAPRSRSSSASHAVISLIQLFQARRHFARAPPASPAASPPARALRASWPAARRPISSRPSRCGRDSRRHRPAGNRGADTPPPAAAPTARSSARKHSETRGSRSTARSLNPLVRRSESLSRAAMPVSGPMAGSGRLPWPLPFGSGCTRNVARPSSSRADEIQAPLGLRPSSPPPRIPALRAGILRPAFRTARPLPRNRPARPAASDPPPCPFRAPRTAASPIRSCRCDAPAPARAIPCARALAKLSLRAPSISRRSSPAARRRSARSSSVRFRSPVTASSSSCRCAMVSESCLRAASSRSISAAETCSSRSERALSRSMPARYSSICASWFFSVEASPSSRRISCRPASMAFSRSRSFACSASRCWLISSMRPRASAVCSSIAAQARLVLGDLLLQPLQPHPQLLRFLLRLRDALFDGAAFLHLRFQPSARALGLHVHSAPVPAAPPSAAPRFRNTPAAAARAPAPFPPPARPALSFPRRPSSDRWRSWPHRAPAGGTCPRAPRAASCPAPPSARR